MLYYLQGIWMTDKDIEVLRTAFVCLKATALKWLDSSTNPIERKQHSELIEAGERLEKLITRRIIKNINLDQVE